MPFEAMKITDERMSLSDLNRALDAIAVTCSKDMIYLICPYISRRIGIAEWIVRADMKQRRKIVEKEKIKPL